MRPAVLLGLALLPGCYGNSLDEFPPGYEPWEENTAPLPAPTADSVCPETLSMVRSMYTDPMTSRMSLAIHARGCIHQPNDVVWAALQVPDVTRDHTSVRNFMVYDPPMAECDGDFETDLTAGPDVFPINFRLCWRQRVGAGTDTAPLLTATRWQKVWGSTAVSLVEGSIVTTPLAMDPSITEVAIQYHLNAVSADHTTLENYLTVFFGRIADQAHGRPLP